MLTPTPPQPELRTPEYELWREFIWRRSGLHFSENRLRFLRRCLWERMCSLQMRSHQEYYHFLAFNPAGEQEWQALLELLVNHETSFFRYPPSYAALSGHVLQNLLKAKQRHGLRTIALWSVGCSTGQEPYSMAMASLEVIRAAQVGERLTWQIKVSGSDISPLALEKARRAIYKPHEVRYMPEAYQRKYLTKTETALGTFFQVCEPVRQMVQFNYLNLSDPANHSISTQDVIFCQNVLIYFRAEHRLAVITHLLHRLNIGGYLFLAPTEMVGLHVPGAQVIQLPDVLIYQRNN
jgi:chemotaxis methyl-accepting protein methylase